MTIGNHGRRSLARRFMVNLTAVASPARGRALYDPAQPNGSVRHVVTDPQEVDKAPPTFAVLTATQKTNATRSTIKVYSTKPCPSSSTTNLFRSSIILSPLSLRPWAIAYRARMCQDTIYCECG